MVWCASWWAHPEAVLRLYALWRAWEALRLEPATGMSSNWWTLHPDLHMRLLLDGERRPFASCTRGQHKERRPGPVPLRAAKTLGGGVCGAPVLATRTMSGGQRAGR